MAIRKRLSGLLWPLKLSMVVEESVELLEPSILSLRCSVEKFRCLESLDRGSFQLTIGDESKVRLGVLLM